MTAADIEPDPTLPLAYDEDRSQIRTGTGPQVKVALQRRNQRLTRHRRHSITAAIRYHAHASSRALAD